MIRSIHGELRPMADKGKKLYYTISEVAEITGVKAHVLRYWEGEFPTLRPRKTRSGSRRYRQRDIDEILAIKDLLYEEGFRISGARKMRRQAVTKTRKKQSDVAPQMAIPFGELEPKAQLTHIRSEISELLTLIRELNQSVTGEKAEEHSTTVDEKKQAEGEA